MLKQGRVGCRGSQRGYFRLPLTLGSAGHKATKPMDMRWLMDRVNTGLAAEQSILNGHLVGLTCGGDVLYSEKLTVLRKNCSSCDRI